MGEQVAQLLAGIAGRFSDSRLQLCELEVAACDTNRCVLSDAVLDEETLGAVLVELRARHPDVQFDAASVQVLRRSGLSRLIVATNLTGLYAQPSFLAEMLSELLAGCLVEVLREQERWCFVRQEDGYLGWVYRPYLAESAGTPPAWTHVVCEPVSLVRGAPAADALLVTRLLGGARVSACESGGGWIHLAPGAGAGGWVAEHELRRLTALPAGESAQRVQIVADAMRFVGVPYRWGGCTAFGIDCSGFARLLHYLSGLSLPRDADMQFGAGRPVEPPTNLVICSSSASRDGRNCLASPMWL
jgi:hypothetical protein